MKRRPLFQGVDSLKDKKDPRGAVENKIEPVNGPDELAFKEHLQFFHYMRREKRGEPQGEANDNQRTPG
jgi:hypothetical protein